MKGREVMDTAIAEITAEIKQQYGLDVTAIMEQVQAQVVEDTVRRVRDSLSWTVQNKVAEQVAPIVKQFVEDEITPELRMMLLSQKGVILEAVAQAAVQIGTRVAETIVKQANDAMNNNYSRGKIIDAVLGKA